MEVYISLFHRDLVEKKMMMYTCFKEGSEETWTSFWPGKKLLAIKLKHSWIFSAANLKVFQSLEFSTPFFHPDNVSGRSFGDETEMKIRF